MTIIDWIIMIAYLAVIILVAIAALKKVRTGKEFAVSGATLPVGIVTATLAAAYIGGSFAVGASGAAYRDGYTYFFALAGFPLAMIAVGIWVAPKLRQYGAETVGDVMEHHYGIVARFLTGVITIVVCAAIVGAQVRALGVIAETFIGVNFDAAAIVLTAIVIAYSTTGGLWSDVRADVLHFAVLSIVIPITILVAIHSAGGGAKIELHVPDYFLTVTGNYGLTHFVSLFIGFVFGETLVQPYAQRAFAGADKNIVRKGFIFAGIFGLLFLFVTSSGGIIAHSMFTNITSDAAVPVLISHLMPAGLTGLAISAFIAVIMSSASGFLNATTTVVVRDIWTAGARRSIDDHSRLRLQRTVNLVIGIAALITALSLPNIIDILMVYYSAWAPSVIIPLILGVLFNFRNWLAGPLAIVCGLTATFIWKYLLHEPYGILALAIGLACNLIVFLIVVGLTKNIDLKPQVYKSAEKLEKTETPRIS